MFRVIVMDIANVLKTVLVGAFHLAQTAIKDLISWFNGHGSEFSAAWHVVVKAVQAAVKWFDDNVIKWVQARVADLVAWWNSHSQELAQVWSKVWLLIQLYVKTAWNMVIHPTLVVLQAVWRLAWMAVWDTIKLVWSAVSGIVTTAMHLILNIIGVVLDIITGHWGKAWQDVKKLVSQGLHDVISTIGNIASGFGTLLYDAGANIIKGLIKGVESMISGIGNTISNVASTIRKFLPFSPAKVGPLSGSGSPDIAGAKIGEMVATGITGSVRKVAGAAHGLAGAAALALGGGGEYGALSVGGGALTINGASSSGGSGQPIIVQIDRKVLFTILQTDILRNGRRNPTTGVVYQTT
jgi:phage-related protein